MVGRHEETSERHPARALWEWFETLPFHRGMSLIGIAVVIPAAVIGGTIVVGGSKPTAAPTPSARGGVHTAAAPRDNWDVYVPPSRVVPTPAGTQHGSMTLVRPTPTAARPRPSPRRVCPSAFMRYPWLWNICRQHLQGHNPR